METNKTTFIERGFGGFGPVLKIVVHADEAASEVSVTGSSYFVLLCLPLWFNYLFLKTNKGTQRTFETAFYSCNTLKKSDMDIHRIHY